MSDTPHKSALDPSTLAPRIGASYPVVFQELCADREKRALGDPLGLTNFGVNLVMYALTGNYKEDQVHVPSILERLGQ